MNYLKFLTFFAVTAVNISAYSAPQSSFLNLFCSSALVTNDQSSTSFPEEGSALVSKIKSQLPSGKTLKFDPDSDVAFSILGIEEILEFISSLESNLFEIRRAWRLNSTNLDMEMFNLMYFITSIGYYLGNNDPSVLTAAMFVAGALLVPFSSPALRSHLFSSRKFVSELTRIKEALNRGNDYSQSLTSGQFSVDVVDWHAFQERQMHPDLLEVSSNLSRREGLFYPAFWFLEKIWRLFGKQTPEGKKVLLGGLVTLKRPMKVYIHMFFDQSIPNQPKLSFLIQSKDL